MVRTAYWGPLARQLLCCLLVLFAAPATAEEISRFNVGWQFSRAAGEGANPEQAAVWETVDLPHMASDYTVERVPEPVATPKRDPFAGLKLNAASVADRTVASPLDKAVQRFARTMADILRSQEQGHSALPHQRDAFYEARDGLDKIRPRGSRDLYAAIKRDGSLVDQAAKGKTANVVRAMDIERDTRITDGQRADRFIDEWKTQTKQLKALDRAGRGEAVYDLRQRMASMAKGLERDPQLESLVRNRVKELGISPTVGQSLSQDLQRSLSLSLSRGLGL